MAPVAKPPAKAEAKPKPAAERFKASLFPFGERFRFHVVGGGYEVNLICDRKHIAQLRDECNAVLKAGKITGRARRARDAKEKGK